MYLITSPANPRIGKLRDLHTPRGRKKNELFLMEGPHLLLALLDAQLLPFEVYYQPDLLQRTSDGRSLLARLKQTPDFSHTHLIEVSERVIEALGDVHTSQGVVSVLPFAAFTVDQVRMRRASVQTEHRRETTQRPALLVLDDIADPGNMGTILRTALAADVDSVLLTPNCVDCYSPKVVRAAAGAHIALPIESDVSWNTIAEKVRIHTADALCVLLAEAGSDSLYYEQNLLQPFALIIGNEAHGPSAEARACATSTVTIPLANGVESLNAAMAAGIILYEAVRQARTQ